MEDLSHILNYEGRDAYVLRKDEEGKWGFPLLAKLNHLQKLCLQYRKECVQSFLFSREQTPKYEKVKENCIERIEPYKKI